MYDPYEYVSYGTDREGNKTKRQLTKAEFEKNPLNKQRTQVNKQRTQVNKPWLQRLKNWRYANIHFALGRWAIWGRGELLLQRIYWRGMWTPFLRTKARYGEGSGTSGERS
jgi:hypothetical protein